MAHCRTNGIEPQSVSSMRLQLCGKHRVIAFCMFSLMKNMQTDREPKDEKPNTVTLGVLGKLMEQKELDALRVSDALAKNKSASSMQ